MKLFPDEAHSDIKHLYQYWKSISPEKGLPGRQHFDPLDIPHLLPRLLLIEVHREPLRFWNRLVGSKIEEFAGESLTGQKYAQRLSGSQLERVERLLQDVVEKRQPSWRRGKPMIRWEKEYVELERLFLPMAEDGETVDMILAITVHSRGSAGEIPFSYGQNPGNSSAPMNQGRQFLRRQIAAILPIIAPAVP